MISCGTMHPYKQLLDAGIRNGKLIGATSSRKKVVIGNLVTRCYTSSFREGDDSWRRLFGIGLTMTMAASVIHGNHLSKSEEGPIIAPTTTKQQQLPKKKAIIETDLLDKLAKKPYVQYHNNKDMGSAKNSNSSHMSKRPKGIPKRVRIFVIDVPEFRSIFTDGECRVNASRIFTDAIAPAKKLNGGMDIPQKTLAAALVRCRKNERIGVELLEASVNEMNPLNLRRIYTFGGYQYDPGKYSSSTKTNKQNNKDTTSTTANDDSESGPADVDEEMEEEPEKSIKSTKNQQQQQQQQQQQKQKRDIKKKVSRSNKDIVDPNEEMEAPWNQYAWIEELYLRVHGLIPFGAPLEPAGLFSRVILGHAYKRTVHSSRSYLSYVIPSFFLPASYSNTDGIDGDYRYSSKENHNHQQPPIIWNRASCKPHAVIVNGAAMQRIPGSLRYLTKCCKEANVPLFVVNDPRVWGQNTHLSLQDAAGDIRKVIKRNILQNALTIKEGNMFERGRQVGRFETDAKWKAQDVSRKTRQAVQDARDKWKRSQQGDWSKLNSKELLQRLVEHKVITPIVTPTTDSTKTQLDQGEKEQYIYTEALIQACQHILQKPQQAKGNANESPDQNQNDSPEPEPESMPKEEPK